MPQGSRHFSLLVSFGPSFARTRLSSTPSISHFLLSLLIIFAPPLSLSLSLFLSHLRDLPCSLRLSLPPRRIFSLRSSVHFHFSRSSLRSSSASSSILRIIRVPRNLILWASLHLSSILVSPPPRAGLSLHSLSDLMEGFCPVRSGIMGS